MNDLASADVDSYMVRVQDQISCFCFTAGYALADFCLTPGRSRQGDTEFSVYALCEAGAVSTISQTGTTTLIWITYELQSVRSNCSTAAASDDCAALAEADLSFAVVVFFSFVPL